ncbi:hypothetical protein EGR_04411 [Echinococcus granulosus]|uniref:Uncharacterized protein n=1 Tax=Echinococcus granulosus TaxID=6210 RepID=W6UGX1_ECHGR|nr:hypothetical protein EGR_04411 [Echinococcus granulosus]EUB60785.1 hypothetical protein EGR_04411 [Echinococcus granulosus]
MDTTERLAVIRLAFHLLRLSVRAFSPDLVHGLAAAFASTSATVLRPAELNLNKEVVTTKDMGTMQMNGEYSTDTFSILMLEVMRSSEVHVERCNEGSDLPAVATSCCPPLEVAVKSLLNALPCCGEPGGVSKHPAQIFEMVLLALLRLSAESQYGRRVVDSWVFQALVLNVLYNLFPGVPALIRTNPADDTANAIAGDLSSALYTGLPYPLASHHPGRRQQQSPFPYLDGDFVVEEGLRLFPLVQSAGTDVLEAHSALLLCCFAQAGLFEANSQLHPNSLCMERLTSIPLLRDKFRAVDFLERVHQILMERHHAGARPVLSAPLISPFLECLSRQQRSPSTPLPPSVPTSAGSKSADIGPVSLMQKASVGAVTTSPSSRIKCFLLPLAQYTDGLLEAVIVASGVCASSSIANTITVQSLAGCSMAATSMLGKSAFLTHVPISHPPIPGVPSTTLILSSPYEWDWDVLASWARKLSSSAGLFSWKDQNSQM